MTKPLVSVICICYNHEKFVEASLLSVLQQSYNSIEILVIDDFSTDESWQVITRLKQQYPQIIIHRNENNQGNCKSFNTMFAKARGKYIIDLATDDVFYLNRIERQVSFFEALPEEFGVIYSNAHYINEQDEIHATHFFDVVKRHPVAGDIFTNLLGSYIICPPTMMMKRSLLERLGGYDETLAYEDYDLWIRSSRIVKYGYQDEILTQKRNTENSLSTKFKDNRSVELNNSTFKVCEKAALMVQNAQERKALAKRLNYEWREALKRKDDKNSVNYKQLIRNQKLPIEWKTRWILLKKN